MFPVGLLAWGVGWGVDWSLHAHDWPAWITVFILLGSAGAAVWALNDAKKTRHGQMVLDIARRWEEPLVRESQLLFSEYGVAQVTELIERTYSKEGSPPRPFVRRDLEDLATLFALPDLAEMIGVLVKKRVIKDDVVFENWGPIVSDWWNIWSRPMDRLRELDRRPSTYRNFQWLAERMKALDARTAESAEDQAEAPTQAEPEAEGDKP